MDENLSNGLRVRDDAVYFGGSVFGTLKILKRFRDFAVENQGRDGDAIGGPEDPVHGHSLEAVDGVEFFGFQEPPQRENRA